MVSMSKWIVIFCVVFLSLTGASCGKKTPLVPPDSLSNKPVTDLSYFLDERGVVLSWSLPKNINSRKIHVKNIDYEILRAQVKPADYCPDCPVRYKKLIVDKSADFKTDDQGKITFYDKNVIPGYRYYYKIKPVAGLFAAGEESNTVSFWWLAPPASPEGLNGVAGDKSVTLTWRKPKRTDNKPTLTDSLLYQVYRSEGDTNFRALGVPQLATTFVDENVQNGVAYSYVVRAGQTLDDSVVYSPASRKCKATPKDLTPPATPRQVTVVQTSEGVKLFWAMVDDQDLSGYRIYRRSAAKKESELVGEVKAPQVIFIDRHPLQGTACYYSVTSFDRQKRPNESKAAAEILFK